MKLDRVIRIGIAAVIALLFVIAIAALLFVTESALNVWDRLLEGPRLLRYGYVAVMVALVVVAAWLIWRLVVRRNIPDARRSDARPLTAEAIRERLAEAEKAGVDVGAAQAELQELAARQAAGSIHLCFFGEISTGKSSLIKALVPSADVGVDVLGGSTTEIRHYRWRDDGGHEILLTDVPGTGGHEEGLSELAIGEAQRAHVVLFVCDGDLTRQESAAVAELSALVRGRQVSCVELAQLELHAVTGRLDVGGEDDMRLSGLVGVCLGRNAGGDQRLAPFADDMALLPVGSADQPLPTAQVLDARILDRFVDDRRVPHLRFLHFRADIE